GPVGHRLRTGVAHLGEILARGLPRRERRFRLVARMFVVLPAGVSERGERGELEHGHRTTFLLSCSPAQRVSAAKVLARSVRPGASQLTAAPPAPYARGR